MYFELIGEISDIERIARGPSVREPARLRKQFGPGNWRKLKGVATVRLVIRHDTNGRIALVRSAWNWKEEAENTRYLD